MTAAAAAAAQQQQRLISISTQLNKQGKQCRTHARTHARTQAEQNQLATDQ
jgi:hypothetical protein